MRKFWVPDLETAHGVDVPSCIGRIPNKIAQNFSSFTADEWKNWCIYYSLFSLKPFLPTREYNNWKDFVEACYILCQPTVSLTDLQRANNFLMDFCRGVQNIYGSLLVTPNMHMHTHLLDCILDYGPVYAFWLFSFERYNGYLGSYPSSKRNIEVQMCRRFIEGQVLKNIPKPSMFNDEFDVSFNNFDQKDVGALADTVSHYDLDSESVIAAKKLQSGEACSDLLTTNQEVTVLGKLSLGLITNTHLDYLKRCIQTVWTDVNLQLISGGFTQYSTSTYLGEKYGNSGDSDSKILASWCGTDGSIDTKAAARPGEIVYLMQLFVEGEDQSERQIDLAYIKWYHRHMQHNHYGSNLVTVWAAPEICCEPDGPASFLPIKRISGKFLHGSTTIQGETVAVVIRRACKFAW